MNPEERTAQIPYFAHEGMMARQERTVRRLSLALIMSVILIFASNVIWLYAWMQYDYTGEETQVKNVDVDAKEGVANYIGNNGSITNGTDTSYNSDGQTESTETEK